MKTSTAATSSKRRAPKNAACGLHSFFAPDGTFTDGGYTVSRSPVTTIGNTMPLHPSSEIVDSNTGAGGRYRIDGYTIEMTRPDGKTHRERFFFWDEDKESFNIGDATWSAY